MQSRIQASVRASAENVVNNKRKFSSMRSFLVGLVSVINTLLPLHIPSDDLQSGFPSLLGQPDLPADGLQHVQTAPGCPLLFHALNPVGICNIGAYEGQLVMKLKDVVSTMLCGLCIDLS
jgi:hypothetical protein